MTKKEIFEELKALRSDIYGANVPFEHMKNIVDKLNGIIIHVQLDIYYEEEK